MEKETSWGLNILFFEFEKNDKEIKGKRITYVYSL
jgi:hypothetical protein